MTNVDVNYLAVVIGAFSNMAVGFAWFGPLFGKQWVAMMGWSQQQMDEGKAKMAKDGWKTYGLAFIGALLMAYVMSHLVAFSANYMGTSGVMVGLTSGFWAWVGFVVPVTLSSVLWEGKSWKYWLLNSSYYLVALLIMGAIIAVM